MESMMLKQETQSRSQARRAAAGKALVIFLIVMAALTLVNRTLQDMTIPTVTAYAPQRGALEIQINADGVLAAAVQEPVVVSEAARVKEILIKTGAGVQVGDALATLDYTDVVKAKHAALVDAIVSASQKQQAYDRASADIGASAIATLENRREALEQAEAALLNAQAELHEAEAALADAQAAEDQSAAAQAEEAVRAAQSALDRAQSNVDYRKRRLDELTGARDYIDKGKDLTTAREKLSQAAEDYFELCGLLTANPHEGADEAGLIDEAIKTVSNGGAAADVIPFDSRREYLSVLTSPVMGDVISVDMSVGSVVSTNAAVMTISDRSRELLLSVKVAEGKVSDMAVGDIAEITIDTDVYECPITSIAASVSEPGMFEVEFILPGDAGSVGMRASMRFKKRTQNYDILIPLAALRSDNDGDFVYVIEQQDGSLGSSTTVRRVNVYVLEKDNTRAALQSGVSQRDLIVARSDREINDGDRVRLGGD